MAQFQAGGGTGGIHKTVYTGPIKTDRPNPLTKTHSNKTYGKSGRRKACFLFFSPQPNHVLYLSKELPIGARYTLIPMMGEAVNCRGGTWKRHIYIGILLNPRATLSSTAAHYPNRRILIIFCETGSRSVSWRTSSRISLEHG